MLVSFSSQIFIFKESPSLSVWVKVKVKVKVKVNSLSIIEDYLGSAWLFIGTLIMSVAY